MLIIIANGRIIGKRIPNETPHRCNPVFIIFTHNMSCLLLNHRL